MKFVSSPSDLSRVKPPVDTLGTFSGIWTLTLVSFSVELVLNAQ